MEARINDLLGFLDVSYAGEVATCRPLADPTGVVRRIAEVGRVDGIALDHVLGPRRAGVAAVRATGPQGDEEG